MTETSADAPRHRDDGHSVPVGGESVHDFKEALTGGAAALPPIGLGPAIARTLDAADQLDTPRSHLAGSTDGAATSRVRPPECDHATRAGAEAGERGTCSGRLGRVESTGGPESDDLEV
ncbi:hypothetical protein PSA01_18730 [Pseudonocardia saturnea]|uniref:Uncharacterized protein n=1 Tax=Pseudonocardia saturnea TaxID=33909 RepID=A0ABQ0RVZ4_9PSEU|nr:hypothetical protein Pdca_46330 [Pseudonocardia autotrophica]GEC24844.1 hypothetical protein PSA01_18730 [Pseudonocardia saturnea]